MCALGNLKFPTTDLSVIDDCGDLIQIWESPQPCGPCFMYVVGSVSALVVKSMLWVV